MNTSIVKSLHRRNWSLLAKPALTTPRSIPGARHMGWFTEDFSISEKVTKMDRGDKKNQTSNRDAQDLLSQYVRAGKQARSNGDNHGIDAASSNTRSNPKDKSQGNPEGLGMLDQVGSATGTANFFEGGGKQGVPLK